MVGKNQGETLSLHLYLHAREATLQVWEGKPDFSALEIIVARGFVDQILEGNYSENRKKYAREMLGYLDKLSHSVIQLALISSIERDPRKFTEYEYLDFHPPYKRFS